jgi:glycosyltransferase involved in cell wall biosynthesis
MQLRQTQLESKQIFISCVVPVFNEAAIIRHFIQTLQAELVKITKNFEIILVDDGSSDQTVKEILPLVDQQIKLLGLSRNFGKEIALTAGLEHTSGEVLFLLDSDFQHPIELLP